MTVALQVLFLIVVLLLWYGINKGRKECSDGADTLLPHRLLVYLWWTVLVVVYSIIVDSVVAVAVLVVSFLGVDEGADV